MARRRFALAMVIGALSVGGSGATANAGAPRDPAAPPGAPSHAPGAAAQSADEARTPTKRGTVSASEAAKEQVRGPSAPEMATPADDSRVNDTVGEGADVPEAIVAEYTQPPASELDVGWGHDDHAEIDAARPDPVVAVGPDHIVHSVDSMIRITDRAGGQALSLSYAQLFELGNVYPNFDGQVIFDSTHQRWVAAETSYDCFPGGGAAHGHGYLDFAVSNSADPTGDWTIYYFAYNDRLPRNVTIGTSADKVAIGAGISLLNACSPDISFVSTDTFVMMWSAVVADAPVADYYAAEPIEEYLNQVLLAPIAPTSNTLHQMVEFAGLPPAYYHQTVTGVVPNTILSRDPVAIAGNSWSTFIRQPGVPVDSPGTDGITSATMVGSRLIFAAGYGLTPNGDTDPRMGVRVVELSVSASTGVVRQDFVLAEVGTYLFGGAVTMSLAGDVTVAYSRTSETDYISAYRVFQPAGSPANTVSPPGLLSAGSSVFADDPWGRTFGGTADPLVAGRAWLAIETVVDGAWRTEVWSVDATVGATFTPIPPTRILDTRSGTGLSGVFTANVPRTFNVAGAGGGLIPADAIAITGNVTIANQTSGGYLSVGPTRTASPTSSTLNFPVGDARANNVTLPLDGNGDLSAVYKAGAGATTALILDVTGYFLADDSGATYEPITAQRVLDSRFGTGVVGKFTANVPRQFQVTGGTIPAEATAVTGNLTVVGQTKAGYVSLTTASDPNPATSTLNFPLGDTRANGVTVPLSDSGSLWAVFKASGGATDLIFDVTGYYVEGTAGLRFYPLNPGRIMDTRFNTLTQLFGPFTSSIPRTLVTGGHFGVPANGLAVTGNLTVVNQTKAGYVSITKEPTANPTVSALNFPAGDVRANGVTVPLNAANDMAIVYKATSGARTHLILDLTGYFR